MGEDLDGEKGQESLGELLHRADREGQVRLINLEEEHARGDGAEESAAKVTGRQPRKGAPANRSITTRMVASEVELLDVLVTVSNETNRSALLRKLIHERARAVIEDVGWYSELDRREVERAYLASIAPPDDVEE